MDNTGYLYTDYARALREKYGVKVYRVGVDGGFSCPNRGQDRLSPGCSYCDSFGSMSAYQRTSSSAPETIGIDERLRWIGIQIDRGLLFLKRRYRAEHFILYFQAFSSTFDSPANLKRIYNYGLSRHPFVELVVSTRPDCISPQTADILASYKRDDRDVWVELGLQSADDRTLRRINRGHDRACFERAFTLLKARGLKIAVHLIFGLPGEGMKDIEETVRYVRSLNPGGLKIHNLHIPDGTAMAEEYRRGELTVPCLERHIDYTIRALELIPGEVIILRLTCDTPAGRLLAPRGERTKGFFYNALRMEMKHRGTYQGRLAGQ